MDRSEKENLVASLKQVFEEATIVVVTHYSARLVARTARPRQTRRAVLGSGIILTSTKRKTVLETLPKGANGPTNCTTASSAPIPVIGARSVTISCGMTGSSSPSAHADKLSVSPSKSNRRLMSLLNTSRTVIVSANQFREEASRLGISSKLPRRGSSTDISEVT